MAGVLTISGARAVADVDREWDALADATGAGPFARPAWFAAWGRAFAPQQEVGVLTVRRDGALAGVLPVLARRAGLRSPTNWHTPAYGPVAADEEVARALADAAVARGGAWVDLAFLDPREPFAEALGTAARTAGRRVIRRSVLRSPYVRLEGDFAAYCRTRSSRLLREVRRRRRRLAEDHGEVTVTFADGREGLEALLREGLAVEGSGWKTQRGTAIAQDPAVGRFYGEVAAWAAAARRLELGFVRVGGRAAAFALTIVDGGVVHVVKVGFDPAYARYAVGTLLTFHSIERAYARGMAVYDFLGAEDAYKLEWTADVRVRVRVQAFAPTASGLAGWAAWAHGRPAGVRVKARLDRHRAGRA